MSDNAPFKPGDRVHVLSSLPQFPYSSKDRVVERCELKVYRTDDSMDPHDIVEWAVWLEGSIFPTPASHVVPAKPVRVTLDPDCRAFGDGIAVTEEKLREARDFIIDGGADRFDVVAGGDSVSGLAARGAPRYRAARDFTVDMPFNVPDTPENNAAIEGILSTGEEE